LNSLLKKKTYKLFDVTTDTDYYWISVLCVNCHETQQIGILKGKKVNSSRLKLMTCPRCEIRKTFVQVKWDGLKYVRIK